MVQPRTGRFQATAIPGKVGGPATRADHEDRVPPRTPRRVRGQSGAPGRARSAPPVEPIAIVGAGAVSGASVAVMARSALVESFVAGLRREAEAGDLLGALSPVDAARLGGRLATQVLADLRWSALVGETLDTTAVRALLDLTRQALDSRRRSGSLLGLSDVKGTTRYPGWQFDRSTRDVRPQVALLSRLFRDEYPEVREDQIVSWASTPQEDLDRLRPRDWIVEGRSDDAVGRSATRAALRLAQ